MPRKAADRRAKGTWFSREGSQCEFTETSSQSRMCGGLIDEGLICCRFNRAACGTIPSVRRNALVAGPNNRCVSLHLTRFSRKTFRHSHTQPETNMDLFEKLLQNRG